MQASAPAVYGATCKVAHKNVTLSQYQWNNFKSTQNFQNIVLSIESLASFNFTIFEALQGLKSDLEKLQFGRFTGFSEFWCLCAHLQIRRSAARAEATTRQWN